MTKPIMIQDVVKVERATHPLDEISTKEAIEQLVGSLVESSSECTGKVVGRPAPREEHLTGGQFRCLFQSGGVVHPMVGAIHQAYKDHRPLVLSPDMFWLLITQGLALHINNNPDEFRDRFRVGERPEEIEVRHDGLYKGSPENPWEEVFEDFCHKIEVRIGEENYSQIVTLFSTTGRVERVANAIVLMDCVKSYFQFGLHTRCGIPQVVLEGSVADWEKLRDKTESLGKTYAMSWWTRRLLPILNRVSRNAAGKDDPQLWQTLYKQINGSGGPYVSGWIADFFPYVGHDEPKYQNPAFRNESRPEKWEQRPWAWCITTHDLPSPLSKVPFQWHYKEKQFRMELLAGFVGFTQDIETLQLRPKIGWAVRDAK
jgi:hypothetical protein